MDPRGRKAGVGGEKGIGGASTRTVLPGFVVTLKAEQPKAVRDFLRLCRKMGVAATPLQGDTYFGTSQNPYDPSEAAETPCFYELVGGDFLAQLKVSRHYAVVERCFILDARVPGMRNTSWDGHSRCPGDASPRVRRECRIRNLPLAAQNEADRREMWSAADHERDQFVRAAELPR